MIFFLFCIFMYFVPFICALARRADNVNGIAVLNLFLGWTLIGWIAALVWAVSAETEEQALAKRAAFERMATAVRIPTPPPPHPPGVSYGE